MDIPDQLPEKRKKRVRRLSEQAKNEGINFTKFGNECLEVYDVTFSQIQWRFEKLTEVYDDFHCVTSEALAIKSVEELQKPAADLALKCNGDINGAEILSEVESLKFQCSAILRLLNIEITRCNLEV